MNTDNFAPDRLLPGHSLCKDERRPFSGLPLTAGGARTALANTPLWDIQRKPTGLLGEVAPKVRNLLAQEDHGGDLHLLEPEAHPGFIPSNNPFGAIRTARIEDSKALRSHRNGGPVDGDHAAACEVESEFFLEFASGADLGGSVGLDGSAGDLSSFFVDEVDEQDASLFAEEEDASGAHSRPLPDLVHALKAREAALSLRPEWHDSWQVEHIAEFTQHVLVLNRSSRWQEAVSTALLGQWCEPLLSTGRLSSTAISVLKTEASLLHRQLLPVWRRRTRHGRVLSLDADLGNGLSLHDLVAAEVDLLAHAADGVFEDERLNAVLRGLNPDQRQVLFALAQGEGATWTEAAAAAGSPDPEAFGECVRRKAKRLANEQRRRTALAVRGG